MQDFFFSVGASKIHKQKIGWRLSSIIWMGILDFLKLFFNISGIMLLEYLDMDIYI